MAKIDIIADCKFSKRFSWLRALLLLIGVTFLTIPPDAWANEKTGTTITYLQIMSIPSSANSYKKGDNIRVHLHWGTPVKVHNTPTLTLVIGTEEKTANYASGTGTNDIFFQYTIAEGDTDTDGFSVKANSLSGTITNLTGDAATLTHDGLDGGSRHQVEAILPTVSSVAFSSTGPYRVGSNIDVTVTMSEAATVSGTPALTLVIGTTEKTANYTSGSGTTALVFRYTVAAGDGDDTDGVSVKENSLNGTITDSPGNTATLTHSVLAGGADHKVDTTAPTVSSIAFHNSGPYSVGNTINVSVKMSEVVQVTGTPQLTLVIGTTEKTANYNIGDDSATLIFQYAVASGDTDTDGVSVKANSLNLNGGTIKDNIDNAATLTHDAVADSGNNQRVDTTPPEVSSLAFSSTGTYSIGSNIDVTVTMNETVTITGTPTLTLVIGTAEKAASYTSGSGTNTLVFRYTVAGGETDTDGVSVKANSLNLNSGTIKDTVGNAARRLHSEVPHAGDSHRVDAIPPRISSFGLTSTGPYKVGDHIEMSVSMTEVVTVTGTPLLVGPIVGRTKKAASFHSGSGTNTLVFRYTVADGDTDTDGISIASYLLHLTGGASIRDAANNDLSNPNQPTTVNWGDSHRVDTTAPTVSSLVFTSTGTYAIGENINVMVVTSENVTVNTEDGTPTITLVVGTTEKTASYHSGTGTKALVFRYTVADGDSDDTDGVSVKANSLALNSGTIKDTVGNALTLTHGAKDGGNDHKVDATPPQLDSSNEAPLAVTPQGPYKTGDNIVVFWRMSENVTVNTENGTPTITLVIGTTEKAASYTSGSGTSRLIFQYTVVAGDADADGVSLKANSLTLNGGTITDSAGNGTILTHSALADGGDVQRVDAIPPSVTSFSFTSAGPYKIGSIIEVSATMNEKVFFIADKVPQPKMPTLTFVIGTKERAATYTGVSGTDTLFFQYTVAEGDGNDTDGVSVKANSLKLNGNTIQDGVENGLTLTHNALADAGDNHRVDGNAPTVSSLAFTSIGPYSTENVIEVTATMSESVIVTGTPQITIVIGTTEKTANYTSGSGTNALAFQYTVVAGDGNDADGVAVKANSLNLNGGSIVDTFSNPATLTHTAVADAGVGHRVDTTLLQIGAVSLTSTGPYGVGSNIEVTVETTKPVTVTGNATLQIVIGRTAKTADYNRRTSTNALVFQYKVAAEDGDDTDGISVKANSLALNGGSILDAMNKPLTLNHDAVTDAGDSHRVDTTGPTVNSLAFTSTGPYRVGDNIEVTLTMSETVTITGTPRLTLVVGTTDKIMSYHSGSGTKALTFRYTVATGDGDDTNGVSVKTNSLSLNGGTMKDDVGNALTNLNHDAVADAGANYRVETTVPQVNSFAFTSTGPYGVGNNIDVTATMSKTVTVTGTPQLTLIIGTAEKKANYTSGTGTTQIVFRYTVATGDGDDTNGVAVKANALNLNGGTITDSVGNALSLNHSGADAGNSHRVDTTAPTVSSIAFTSTGPYGVGNNIDVKATMSESVTVTGTPQLTLLIGTTEKTASYHSGTGTNALVFRYTVAAADSDDADGPAVKANSLNSNGGTITDSVSNAATLTHSTVTGGANHRVDTTGPTVNSLLFTSTGPYGVGNNIDVTLTFSKTVTVTGTPQITIVIGTTNKIANYTSGTGTNALVFRYTVIDGDTDTDGPAVKADALTRNTGSIVDALSNPATLTHDAVANAGSSHRVDTTGPTVSAIEFTNTGPFRAGETIEMRVTMSETVTITGTPQLTLVIGTMEKTAGYILGTGTKTLVFQYKVAAGDGDDTDGVSVKANALSLNGGTITDSVENAATLTHTAQDAGNKHRVDTTRPTVSAIAFTSTGAYSIGDNIDVTATMSETVTITGTPQLTLTIGNTDKIAKYHSGTATNALLFRYTVATGDSDDTDGVSVKANALKLNSGTIKDSIGNAATLTHTAVDGGNTHRVDTTPPTVISVAIISAGPYGVGSNIRVKATMSESVTVTGTPQITLVIGTTEKTAYYHSGTGTTELIFQYTVAVGDTDINGISVKANSLRLNTPNPRASQQANSIVRANQQASSIVDAAKNPATLTPHDAVPDAGNSHRVDTTAPAVSSIAFTSTGPYDVGSNIDVTLTISKPVTVAGTPNLTLIIGSAEKIANYHRSSETTKLVFRYTVAMGDDDADGVSVKANSLNLNGGSIVGQFGKNLNLNHDEANAGNQHRVDTILPAVRSIAFASTGPYSIGSNIEVTVTTTKDVTVTGNATLKIVIGNTVKTANYHRRSKTNALVFRYTVTNGDSDDTDGVSVRANSLFPNGGSIVDASNKALNLNHDGIDGGLGHRVDTTAPAIRSIAFTSTGPYNNIGDRIDIAATIGKTVTVTGTPTLTLIIGTVEKPANYYTGTGTTQLNFRYTVTAGDVDPDGVSVKINSLALNGGNIVDAFGGNLTLTHDLIAGGVSQSVDAIPPEIRSIAFTSTGPYNIGSSIDITATISKTVTVTGTPSLTLMVGNTQKTANYHTGTGTTELVFRYTVTAGDIDPDGVSVRANSLLLNGGNIVDAFGSNLTLTHDSITGGISQSVDTILPEIRSIAFTSTGPYSIGSNIDIAATISKTVTVIGTPSLTLMVGNTQKTARYQSGTGTTELVFRYTVADGDMDPDGVSVRANSLLLNGGSILDTSNNVLNLNHNALQQPGGQHVIDTTRLAVSSLAFTSTGPYKSWDNIDVTVTTTKPVNVTGNATLKIVIGNTEKTANYHSGSTTNALVFRYTVVNGDMDPDGISVKANSLSTNGGSIVDATNNPLILNHDALSEADSTHQVDTIPPTVNSIAFTSTGPYGVGNFIEVTVMTSEKVQVAGKPTLTLIIGNTEKTARYLRGSRTDALVFRYIVATGDGDDPDGVSVKANSLAVNGSIIMDLLGNDLDLKHNAVMNGGDSQIVGTTVSGISSLAFTSTGPYKIDDTITITVQTTEKVTVTGIPRIPMILGTATKYANYVSGSGTTVLFFQYTVVAGDEDTDGIEIAPNALENNEGSSIKNNYRTDVNLSHAGVPANLNQIVDTTIPKVVSVDFGDTSTTYAVGDEIEVVVTFEETGVQVNPAADGTLPSVTLLLGTNTARNSQKTAVAATYKESRPGSTKLVFTYTITEDTPMDVDGVQIKRDGLMIPTGTSIHDASGNTITSNEAENGQLTVLPRESTLISSRPILPAITSTSVIFNEFLNASSNKHDWVELRNLSETDIALADWQITISAGKATKNNVVKFPDITLPAGQVLLLINTPHKDTRLTLSKHFSYRYLLMPELQLPQSAFMLTLQNRAGAIMDIMGSYFADESAPDTPIFEQDQAYAREKPSVSGYDTTAWILSGYHAGLGYDRNVPEETSPGTPGYLRTVSIPQNEIAPVSISEIMYVTGKSGKLPQWIELYNASKARIISMRGWKLQLELSTEHDALHRSFSTFVIQDSLQILPNQTILIVTKNGRNSNHFPESRVYNLTQQHPDDIKKLSPEDEITGVTGFAVVLNDARGNQVDIVGNLDGQSGTNDEPTWKLLNGLTQNGNRTSIIRQYEDGTPLTGTKRSSWFRAATIKRTVQTYWGHAKDAGNPGWKKGTALPVQLSSFKAERTDAGAVITWHTESELENAGFNILRSETKNGTFTVINPKLIPGAGTTADRNTYQYIDTGTKPGQHYYYQLEDVSFTGIRQTLTTQRLRRNISPVGQRLTTFGAIKKGDQ